MPDGLYDTDALLWSEQQSALLRRLAAGEGVNEAIDWAHVIEELEDVGTGILRSCESLLVQAMVHLLKLHSWPDNSAVAHWHDETGAFLDGADLHFTPSMQQRIDIDMLYARARRRFARVTKSSGPGRPVPEVCPFTLADLLRGDVDDLLAAAARS